MGHGAWGIGILDFGFWILDFGFSHWELGVDEQKVLLNLSPRLPGSPAPRLPTPPTAPADI
jgi:hypothetical protein